MQRDGGERFQQLEDTYLQVLARAVPEDQHGHGFFVVSDAQCQRLRFIPPLDHESDGPEDLTEFRRSILALWREVQPSGGSAHQKILRVALRLRDSLPQWDALATRLLARADMRVSGSLLERQVLSAPPRPDRLYMARNYPDTISSEHWTSEACVIDTVPILVSEYLAGMFANRDAMVDEKSNVTVHLLSAWALSQPRGSAVWFDFVDNDQHEDGRRLFGMSYSVLDSLFSTAVTDVFVARMLDALGEIGSMSTVSPAVVDAFGYLYLCTTIEFSDRASGAIRASASRNDDGHWTIHRAGEWTPSSEWTGVLYQLDLEGGIAEKLRFDRVTFRSSFENGADRQSPRRMAAKFEELINQKLRRVVMSAEQVHQQRRAEDVGHAFRAVVHSLHNTIDRGIPADVAPDQVRRILHVEKLSAEGFRTLIGGQPKSLPWRSGGCNESIGESIARALWREGLRLRIDDDALNGHKVNPLLVCMLIELARNLTYHWPYDKTGAEACIRLSTRREHDVTHVTVQYEAHAIAASARRIRRILSGHSLRAEGGGIAALHSVATRICCSQCSGRLVWQFKSEAEECEDTVEMVGTWPCHVQFPAGIRMNTVEDDAPLRLTFSAVGLDALMEN